MVLGKMLARIKTQYIIVYKETTRKNSHSIYERNNRKKKNLRIGLHMDVEREKV